MSYDVIKTKKDFIWSIDVSSRAKREQAASLAIDLLKYINSAEEAFLMLMPLNMWDSDTYKIAEHSSECLTEAVGQLIEAY